mgnify:CR=1 FL=1
MPISAPSFPPLLQVAGLSAGYGKIGVLNGIDLQVGQGEIVALLGPNGAGKSTLLKAVSGLLPRTGTMTFGGQDISRAGPGDTVRLGLVHVVEGHRVFTQQTVHDNLLLAGYGMARGELAVRVEEALAFFPEIAANLQKLVKSNPTQARPARRAPRMEASSRERASTWVFTRRAERS